MRNYLVIVILVVSGQAVASDISPVTGLSVSAGHSKSDFGSGHNTELSVFSLFLGASLESKKLSDKNIFGRTVAIGFTPLLQYHYGNSNEGKIQRFKTEFCPINLFKRGFVFPHGENEPSNSLGRLSVNISYEKFEDNEELNNYSVGIGWVFN